MFIKEVDTTNGVRYLGGEIHDFWYLGKGDEDTTKLKFVTFDSGHMSYLALVAPLLFQWKFNDSTALVLKDTFAPRFASIQAILDLEIFKNLRGNSG